MLLKAPELTRQSPAAAHRPGMSEIAEFTRHLGNYLPPPDIALVERAFQFSDSAHRGQFRKSRRAVHHAPAGGRQHPLAVAPRRAGSRRRAAARRDGGHRRHQVARSRPSFGKPVADMVDGVSKLDQIEFTSREDAQAENFRKMLLAMAQDVRVILIKLADRLHNMRTLDAMAPRAPAPDRARDARHLRADREPARPQRALPRAAGPRVQAPLPDALPDPRQRDQGGARQPARGDEPAARRRSATASPRRASRAVVSGREKTIYSVYKKMREKHYTFSQVFDIYGVRVLVPDATACYAALGALHSLYKPIPGKFKDYIAIPKANGYQSLHTTLFGPFGTPLEAQIRTHDMHRIAEAGVAAHWLYKSGGELDLAQAQQRDAPLAAEPARDPVRIARLEGIPREHQGRPVPGRDLRVHAEGQDHGAAARRDRRRLRLRGAHRHRPPLRRGADQLRADAAAHRAQERRPGRDPDVADRAARTRRGCRSSAPARRARASAIS